MIPTILIISASLLFPSVIFAYPQVLGKKDARGQIKKQEVDVTVGTVEEVGPNKIGVKTKQGQKVEIGTDNNTKFLEKPSGRKLVPGQIKKDDMVATVATASAQATISAKLVLVRSATDSAVLKKRRAVYGLVRSISGNILLRLRAWSKQQLVISELVIGSRQLVTGKMRSWLLKECM